MFLLLILLSCIYTVRIGSLSNQTIFIWFFCRCLSVYVVPSCLRFWLLLEDCIQLYNSIPTNKKKRRRGKERTSRNKTLLLLFRLNFKEKVVEREIKHLVKMNGKKGNVWPGCTYTQLIPAPSWSWVLLISQRFSSNNYQPFLTHSLSHSLSHFSASFFFSFFLFVIDVLTVTVRLLYAA